MNHGFKHKPSLLPVFPLVFEINIILYGSYISTNLFILQTPVVEDNVKEVADALQNVTNNIEDVTPDDVSDISQTLRNIVEVEVPSIEVLKLFKILGIEGISVI